ncbi:unnamed protein product [Schistocephalus solidus]|uniref:Uncharacterized protein n=1 Tax=Schistocephalus solidus TaxID=70667 RepID=A0A183SIS4_SCHSO|nr:unnamed protein product [Schistocephalus solidus]
MRHHAIVELTHHVSESLGKVKFLHDLPQSFKIQHFEGFFQIPEGRVEVSPHLLTLLRLARGEDHLAGAAMVAKTTLAIEENLDDDFPGDVEQRDSSAVVTDLAALLLLIEVDDFGVLEVLRDLSLAPHCLEERCELIHRLGTTILLNRNQNRS